MPHFRHDSGLAVSRVTLNGVEMSVVMDPQLEDFYVRVARIEAARRKGFGFEAAGTMGRSHYTRKTRRSFPIFRPLLVVALCVIGLKSVIHYKIGDETYRDRVVELQSGEGFDRLGGYLMAVDPVTLWVSNQIAQRMPVGV
jgi:hypothetical protein